LHINDYADHPDTIGEYDGFAVYVPDPQYSTSVASKALGEALAKRLALYHPKSSLPQEGAGVVEDQDLIAVGSNNTVDSASVLIEYGYIYEPQFLHKETRSLALKDYAYETYLGIQDFFGDAPVRTYSSGALPYAWSSPPKEGKTSPEAYALQSALRYLGYYPPPGKSLSDCPISGYFGACSVAALKAFQKTSDLPVTGTLNEGTILELSKRL
jgi:peptidoglycan hydrolase-like protein with peptidoglycan-binding domain